MRYLCGLIVAALMLAPMAMLQAGGHGGCTDGCCEVQCPQCNHTCKFSVGTDKEAKHCYGSECKPICIPKVVFPWQKKACCNTCDSCTGGCDSCAGGCDSCAGNCCSNGGPCGCAAGCEKPNCCSYNNGACVRYVNVLKKFEYECEVCKYKWEAIKACRVGCGDCAGSMVPMAPAAPAVDAAPTPAEPGLPPAPPPVDAAGKSSRNLLRYISY